MNFAPSMAGILTRAILRESEPCKAQEIERGLNKMTNADKVLFFRDVMQILRSGERDVIDALKKTVVAFLYCIRVRKTITERNKKVLAKKAGQKSAGKVSAQKKTNRKIFTS